jgi:hypothetical protein
MDEQIESKINELGAKIDIVESLSKLLRKISNFTATTS